MKKIKKYYSEIGAPKFRNIFRNSNFGILREILSTFSEERFTKFYLILDQLLLSKYLGLTIFTQVLYESPYESQFWMIFSETNELVASGDYVPTQVKLPKKGKYTIKVQFRYEEGKEGRTGGGGRRIGGNGRRGGKEGRREEG
jgi:hypothetical protein